MCSWIGIVTFIRCNIQHISRYIVEIEKKINQLTSENYLYYETKHAPTLWFSNRFIILAALTALPFITAYLFSVIEGYKWLTSFNFFSYDEYVFVLFSLIFGGIIIYLFIEIPKRTRFKQ